MSFDFTLKKSELTKVLFLKTVDYGEAGREWINKRKSKNSTMQSRGVNKSALTLHLKPTSPTWSKTLSLRLFEIDSKREKNP